MAPSTLKSRIRQKINRILAFADLELIRKWEKGAVRDFIPFAATLAAAKRANLSVGDYIDATYAEPAATQKTIDEMARLGVFEGTVRRVCEIGPGSGRYLEKILQAYKPDYYEVYETATEWSDWLTQTYEITAHACDGSSLSSTPSNSIDLVHAHKLYVYLPFVITRKYFTEMARVVVTGGHVVFDLLTEACLDEIPLDGWSAWAVVPKQFAIDFFERREISFVDSFFIPMAAGKTECLVFVRKPS